MAENIASVIIGRKHTGKSTLANKMALQFHKKHPKKRVLIINVNGSPAYDEHGVLNYNLMTRWKSGIYQFYDPDHDRMFQFLMTHFAPDRNPFNGLILFEDCTKYIDPNPSKFIKSFLVDHRMWKADLMFTFHSLRFVPLFFWNMVNKIHLLKTQDIMSSQNMRFFESRIPNWSSVHKAWLSNFKSTSNYVHRTVNTLI